MSNFTIVLLVLGFVASAFVGAMVWAYQGTGSIDVVFLEVMPVPLELSQDVRSLFKRGVSQYCRGQYRSSANYFVQVLRVSPDLGVAYHNYALALANQREITKSTKAFLSAAERYTQVGDRLSADLVKQHLRTLKRSVKKENKADAS